MVGGASSKGRHCVLQHLHEVLTATEAGRDSNINNSMENIMPRVKLIDASLKVSAVGNSKGAFDHGAIQHQQALIGPVVNTFFPPML